MRNYEEQESQKLSKVQEALAPYQSYFKSPIQRLSVIKGGL
jgi:hypothetical protein